MTSLWSPAKLPYHDCGIHASNWVQSSFFPCALQQNCPIMTVASLQAIGLNHQSSAAYEQESSLGLLQYKCQCIDPQACSSSRPWLMCSDVKLACGSHEKRLTAYMFVLSICLRSESIGKQVKDLLYVTNECHPLVSLLARGCSQRLRSWKCWRLRSLLQQYRRQEDDSSRRYRCPGHVHVQMHARKMRSILKIGQEGKSGSPQGLMAEFGRKVQQERCGKGVGQLHNPHCLLNIRSHQLEALGKLCTFLSATLQTSQQCAGSSKYPKKTCPYCHRCNWQNMAVQPHRDFQGHTRKRFFLQGLQVLTRTGPGPLVTSSCRPCRWPAGHLVSNRNHCAAERLPCRGTKLVSCPLSDPMPKTID